MSVQEFQELAVITSHNMLVFLGQGNIVREKTASVGSGIVWKKSVCTSLRFWLTLPVKQSVWRCMFLVV